MDRFFWKSNLQIIIPESREKSMLIKKSHEKSTIKLINGSELKGKDVILQIDTEKQYTNNGYGVYLAEVVPAEEYDRTTAEGRARQAEAELDAEIMAHKIEMEEMLAKIEAIEELLAEAQDTREGLRNAIADLQRENTALYNALQECRRIFGDLPWEIEGLLAHKIEPKEE